MKTARKLLWLAVLGAGFSAFAQREREIVQGPAAVAPDLAVKMNLHGAVKLKIWITPEGNVRRVEYIGGHPLLAESALKAVKGWKYGPTDRETWQVVEVKF